MCPHCGQAAPLVYRGVLAYCSACGQLRGPLTGRSVTHAGQVSKAGSVVAKTFAWLTLGTGAALALFFGALLSWWVLSGMIGIVTFTVFALLMWGGSALAKSGRKNELETKESAIHSLAAARRGELRGVDLMQNLGISKEEGDALLEQMSKAHPDSVTMEIDAQGGIYYVFPRFRQRVGEGERIATQPAPGEDPLLEQFAALEAEEAAAASRKAP